MDDKIEDVCDPKEYLSLAFEKADDKAREDITRIGREYLSKLEPVDEFDPSGEFLLDATFYWVSAGESVLTIDKVLEAVEQASKEDIDELYFKVGFIKLSMEVNSSGLAKCFTDKWIYSKMNEMCMRNTATLYRKIEEKFGG